MTENDSEVWGEEVAAGEEEGSGVGPFRQWSERGKKGPPVSCSTGQLVDGKRFAEGEWEWAGTGLSGLCRLGCCLFLFFSFLNVFLFSNSNFCFEIQTTLKHSN